MLKTQKPEAGTDFAAFRRIIIGPDEGNDNDDNEDNDAHEFVGTDVPSSPKGASGRMSVTVADGDMAVGEFYGVRT